jgi:hypothetical protein
MFGRYMSKNKLVQEIAYPQVQKIHNQIANPQISQINGPGECLQILVYCV